MRMDQFLEQSGVQVAPEGHHHARGGWLQMDCPFCSKSSQRYRLGYNTYGNYFNCWVCGPKKTVETLVELTGRPKQFIVQYLFENFTPVFDKTDRATGTLKIPAGVGRMLRAHRSYLSVTRNLNPDKIEKLWHVQGIGLASKLSWRLWIPIQLNGRTVSWTTRTIGTRGLRYVSASPEEEAVCHKDLLYGEDYCRHAVVVCEGPIDVWAIGPGAVATFGTSYSRKQLLRMVKYPVRVVCYDNEPEAQQRARRLCDDLEAYPGQTYNVVLEQSKDPGDSAREASGADEVKELRRRFLGAD